MKKRLAMRREKYPEVRGEVVDYITHSVDNGMVYFTVWFKDKTAFSLRYDCDLFILGCRLQRLEDSRPGFQFRGTQNVEVLVHRRRESHAQSNTECKESYSCLRNLWLTGSSNIPACRACASAWLMVRPKWKSLRSTSEYRSQMEFAIG